MVTQHIKINNLFILNKIENNTKYQTTIYDKLAEQQFILLLTSKPGSRRFSWQFPLCDHHVVIESPISAIFEEICQTYFKTQINCFLIALY